MALISLRSRSRVKASMVLTRAYYLFIYYYIILRPIVMVRMGLECPVSTYRVSETLANMAINVVIIYIYIYYI